MRHWSCKNHLPHIQIISILVYHSIYNLSICDYLTFSNKIDRIYPEMEVKTMKKLICILFAMLLLTACSAGPEPTTTPQPTTVPTLTEPTPTDPPITEPPVTEPPVTEPPVTEPPVIDPPDDPPEEPFAPHENFDAAKCASLIGTWSTKITLSGEIQNLELFTGKTEFTLNYTFDEEGRFSTWVDQATFTSAIDEFEALMVDHMVELRYFTFRGPLEYQGLTEEAILEQWGKGPEQEARQECEKTVAALNLYYRFKRLLREGQYYVNGSKVYTQLSADKFESNSFTVNGKIMSLNNTNNMPTYRDICVDFPLIFNKSE